MENIYLHGINHNNNFLFSERRDLEVLEQILASNYILSRKLQNERNNETIKKAIGYNGANYISLCDYDLRNNPPYNNDTLYKTYNSYKLFIEHLIAIIINKEKIEVIKPVIVNPILTRLSTIDEMKKNPQYKNSCFADLPDEVQVKDKVSLDYMKGITIPSAYFKSIFLSSERDFNETLKRAIELIKSIDELLIKYGRKNKIYSLDDFQEIKNNHDIEKHLIKSINK